MKIKPMVAWKNAHLNRMEHFAYALQKIAVKSPKWTAVTKHAL